MKHQNWGEISQNTQELIGTNIEVAQEKNVNMTLTHKIEPMANEDHDPFGIPSNS